VRDVHAGGGEAKGKKGGRRQRRMDEEGEVDTSGVETDVVRCDSMGQKATVGRVEAEVWGCEVAGRDSSR
jgi:ribosomal protein L37AE/L43A